MLYITAGEWILRVKTVTSGRVWRDGKIAVATFTDVRLSRQINRVSVVTAAPQGVDATRRRA